MHEVKNRIARRQLLPDTYGAQHAGAGQQAAGSFE
jgi:hypothetical protein